MANFEIEWDAPEYLYTEKSPSWFWISIIISALIIAFAVWERNFLFGLFIVIAEVLIILRASGEPREIRFLLSDKGISMENKDPRAWKEFEKMSVDELADGWNYLIFYFRAKFKTPLKILVQEDKLSDIRANLKTLIKETPYEPTLLDSIEKLLGF